MRSCTAVAPSSTANLGPGFDVFGLALDPLSDRVRITRKSGRSRSMVIRVLGPGGKTISPSPESNTAGRAVRKMAQDFGIEDDLLVEVKKGVPTGLGLGSSAASAAAGALALDGLYGLGMNGTELVRYAAEGEIASAGTRHYDNVSASVLGGFVIVRVSPELELIRVEPPEDLVLVVAVPRLEVPLRKTEFARRLLPKSVPLKNVVRNISNAGTVVAGFLLRDVEMIARGIEDVIVEPARRQLIPGYQNVKEKALRAGALAVTISGAGPSMISLVRTDRNALSVARAMSSGFREAGVGSRALLCRPGRGAKVIDPSRR